ncbi:MAG: hypothetical protein HY724_04120 [Candidatus Rokubacteria bacterium]|nr:hypothetical protein [Candidatus Rokubacteria bacterium]
MRIGCFGCLTLTVAILVVVVAAAGFLFLSGNMLEAPEFTQTRFTRGDGFSAQQKLYEIVLRQSGRSNRQDDVVLTEQEVNAFLANHLAEAAGLPFNPLSVTFVPGVMEVRGRTPLRNLLRGPPFVQLLPYLPAERLDRPIWVTVRGRIIIEPGPSGSSRAYGRVDVAEFSIGKQPVGSWLLSFMLGSTGSRLLRWQVPAVVQEVRLEQGRAIVSAR